VEEETEDREKRVKDQGAKMRKNAEGKSREAKGEQKNQVCAEERFRPGLLQGWSRGHNGTARAASVPTGREAAGKPSRLPTQHSHVG
jgi:hypothetical protein